MVRIRGCRSYQEAEIEKLRVDKKFSAIYLKTAFDALNYPEDEAVGLLALRAIAQAHGGLAKVAKEAGINREALYRALSPKGNPTFKTLQAVLRVTGARLSIEFPKPAKRRNLSTT